jgi:hypothetical protein
MSHRYLLDKRLSGPQDWSGGHGEKKSLAFYRDSNSNPSAVQPVSSRYADCTIIMEKLYLAVLDTVLT